MDNFKFKMSLRFFGASFDPLNLSAILEMTPTHMWKVGEKRRTPRGRSLEGTYAQSYCSFDISLQGDEELNVALDRVSTRFSKHKNFFERFRTGDGRIEIFVGWFSCGNTGSTLSCELMGKLAGLGIDLALDVYGSDPEAKRLD